MLRKKICSILSAVMIATTVFGTNVQVVGATVNTENSTIEIAAEQVVEDGIYKITNKALKEGTDNNSGIRGYIAEDSIVTVKDGKITVTMKYTDTETVRSTNAITINGETVNFVKNEDGSISFEVDSLDVLYSRIVVNITYYNEGLPEFVFPGKLHTVNFELLHEGELKEIEDDSVVSPETPEVNPETPEVQPDLGNGDSSEEVVEKTYTIKNQFKHENAIGQSMIEEYFGGTSKLEKVNDQYIVKLPINDPDNFLSNFKVLVNGKEVESKLTNARSATINLEFAVNSLSDSIKISVNVAPMQNRVVEFEMVLLEDTLEEVIVDTEEDNKEESDTNTSTGNGSSSTENNVNNSTGNEIEEETEVKETVTVKVYNVQNNVTHENSTGVDMARQYLNSNTEVKEINGKYYVTLTFTGTKFMQNHAIYVNGSKVSHNVVASSSDSISIRFVMSSLNDSISVQTYVVPMGRTVEFGVQLLLDTMTLVDEYTIEADELPETGAATSSAVAVALGLAAVGSGAVIRKKRK